MVTPIRLADLYAGALKIGTKKQPFLTLGFTPFCLLSGLEKVNGERVIRHYKLAYYAFIVHKIVA